MTRFPGDAIPPTDVIQAVDDELRRALAKFPPLNSPHEGYAVILEELDELKAHVWKNTGRTPEAGIEAIQIAAMAVRYAVECCGAALAGKDSTKKEEE